MPPKIEKIDVAALLTLIKQNAKNIINTAGGTQNDRKNFKRCVNMFKAHRDAYRKANNLVPSL